MPDRPALPDPLVASDPDFLGGAPRFNGTRVHVKTLFDYLAKGHPLDEFLRQFPTVSREHAVAVLNQAGAKLAAEAKAAQAA